MAHSQVTEKDMLTKSIKNLRGNISGPAAESVALIMASMDPSEAELSTPAGEQDSSQRAAGADASQADRHWESFGCADV